MMGKGVMKPLHLVPLADQEYMNALALNLTDASCLQKAEKSFEKSFGHILSLTKIFGRL